MERDEDPLNPPELGPKPEKKPPEVILLVFKWLVIILIPTPLLVRYLFTSAGRSSGQLTACRSRIKEVATALEQYAADNAGCYPRELEQLVKAKNLPKLPTCPAAGKMTYTDYQVARWPDNFTFSCVGDHHVSVYGKSARNYPRYNAERGLEEPDR